MVRDELAREVVERGTRSAFRAFDHVGVGERGDLVGEDQPRAALRRSQLPRHQRYAELRVADRPCRLSSERLSFGAQ